MLAISDWVLLPMQVVIGVAVYVAGSLIFRVDSFEYLLSIVKRFVSKKKSA